MIDSDLVARCGVLGLHSHTMDEPCDDTCSIYDRREDSDG